MSSSINSGNDYKGRLGYKMKYAVGMFTAGYSVTTIQQLLMGKHDIVMKRSLHHLINNLRANYWAHIIGNNKRPYYHF